LVAISLLVLGIFIIADAVRALAVGDHPSASPVGIVITGLSLGVMGFLARAKRTSGESLGSRALILDAFQTKACLWLSATTLVGLTMNAVLGLWWADPVAAIVIASLVLREAIEAWRGDDETPVWSGLTVQVAGPSEETRCLRSARARPNGSR
jgi:divalent metal cation (Fe/Co/Zn/Cd) transporter